MPGLFGILELARGSLLAHKLALNVTGNNIANVETPGYTRQRVDLESAPPINSTIGQLGTGVLAVDVHRLRDRFLDERFWRENHILGRWESLEKHLNRLEALFNEVDVKGLGGFLEDFWKGWNDLANNPEDRATRLILIEKARALVETFHRLDRELVEQQRGLSSEIAQKVDRINTLAQQIADLNEKISQVEAGGHQASVLRDQRDLLIDELSKIVDLKTLEKADGSVEVLLGSRSLVYGGKANPLVLKLTSDNGGVSKVLWGDGRALEPSGGELKGLIETRDELIPSFQQDLDRLAKGLVTAVNQLHRQGYGLDGSTGLDFFDPDGITAKDISLSGEITSDPSKIAASSDGNPGDNANALAIAELRDSLQMRKGTQSFSEFYNSLVAAIGAKRQEAGLQRESAELLVNQIENQRASAHGVSLEEEMVNLVRFQQAFGAATKVVTVVEGMIAAVLNMV